MENSDDDSAAFDDDSVKDIINTMLENLDNDLWPLYS